MILQLSINPNPSVISSPPALMLVVMRVPDRRSIASQSTTAPPSIAGVRRHPGSIDRQFGRQDRQAHVAVDGQRHLVRRRALDADP